MSEATKPALYERAFKTELDPTVAQIGLLGKHVAAARTAHNWALERWMMLAGARALTRASRHLSRVDWKQMEAAGWFSFALRGMHMGEPIAQRAKAGEGGKPGEKKPKGSARYKYRQPAQDDDPDVAAHGDAIHASLTREKNRPESPLAWLKDVSAFVVREAVHDVADGWKHFFENIKAERYDRAGTPRFRNRRQSRYHADQPNPIRVTERTITIPGVGEVRLKEKGYLPATHKDSHFFVSGGKIFGIGISEVAGRWYVALRCSVRVLDPAPRAAGSAYRSRNVPRVKGLVVGVDSGIRHLAVTSKGQRFPALETDKRLGQLERRLKLWQRRLSRRYKKGVATREQSQGWKEACREVAKYHRMISQVRDDRVGVAVRQIIDTGAERVVVRGQSITAMKTRREGESQSTRNTKNALAPRIQQARMGDLTRRLGYKMRWAEGECVTADANYPSTRRCSVCGFVRESDPGYPKFSCPSCGHTEDRETNAAVNLREYTPEKDTGGSGPAPGAHGQAVNSEAPAAAQANLGHPPDRASRARDIDQGTPSGVRVGSGGDRRGKTPPKGHNGRANREPRAKAKANVSSPDAPATGESRSADRAEQSRSAHAASRKAIEDQTLPGAE